jgi:hypothetical protein
MPDIDMQMALDNFGMMLSNRYTADEVAPAMTCSEVDAIVVLLARIDQREGALAWITGHASNEGEDFDDSHYEVDPEVYLGHLLDEEHDAECVICKKFEEDGQQ